MDKRFNSMKEHAQNETQGGFFDEHYCLVYRAGIALGLSWAVAIGAMHYLGVM